MHGPEKTKPQLRSLRRRTMQMSIAEGGIALITVALSDAFYIPYLIAMGATVVQVALGASLPTLFAGLAQSAGYAVLKKIGTRKKVLVITTILHAICFIPMALLWQLGGQYKVWLTIVTFLIGMIMASLSAPSWADWFSHIVPQKRFGKYFAFRNRILSLVQMAVALTAGYLLDYGLAKVMLVFTLIWLTCCGARLIGTALFYWHYDPPLLSHNGISPQGLISFMRDKHNNKFGVFTVACALINLGAGMASPFFIVHMINNLHWPYFSYTAIAILPLVTTVLFSSVWGKWIDRFGSLTVLKYAMAGIIIQPLPWIFATNYWLLFTTQVLGGVCWCGFNLIIFIFCIKSTRSEERISAVSYFNAIYAISFFIGGVGAGIFEPYLPVVSHWSLQSLFLMSAVVRMAPLILLRYVRLDQADSPTASRPLRDIIC